MGVFSDDPALDAAMFYDFTSGGNGGSSSGSGGSGCGGCFVVLIIVCLAIFGLGKCGCSGHKETPQYSCVDSDSIALAEDTMVDTCSYSSPSTDDTYHPSSSTYHYNDSYSYSGGDDDEYDEEGYNSEGYDRDGYDRDGYDEDGYDEEGIDEDGYDEDGNYTGDW